MGRTCAVVGCRTGYKKEEKDDHVTLHVFPQDRDLLKEWLRRIARKDKPSKYSGVCSKHFKDDDFITTSKDTNKRRKRASCVLQKRYLKSHAIPSIFPHSTGHFPPPPPTPRSENATSASRLQSDVLAVEAQYTNFVNQDQLQSFEDLRSRAKSDAWTINYTNEWAKVDSENHIQFICLDFDPNGICRIASSLFIDSNLVITVVSREKVIPSHHYRHLADRNNKISLFTQFTNLLAFVKSLSEGNSFEPSFSAEVMRVSDSLLEFAQECSLDVPKLNRLQFLCEQLRLLVHDSNFAMRYSSNLITISYLLYFTSPSSYRVLRSSNILFLPTIRHLQTITKPISQCDIRKYLSVRISSLNQFQRYVVLIIDEIYVEKKRELSGGKIFGYTSDSRHLARTALVFMISSITGGYRDVVKIVPTDSLNSVKLNESYEFVIQEVQSVGFQVVCISVDNHPVNRRFFAYLCHNGTRSSVENPNFPNQPIFLTFDTTHNVKNLFNNWDKKKEFKFSQSEGPIANIGHLKEICTAEIGRPIKIAPQLNLNIFSPSSIQKTSTKFAAAIFNEKSCHALRHYATPCNKYNDTAEFIDKVLSMWKILNVRSPNIGKAKRDKFRDPITSSDDWKLGFLEEMQSFFMKWRDTCTSQDKHKHSLSKETFEAIIFSLESICKLCRYLMAHCQFNYVLLGHISSDNLEERFGWIRQLSGANYYISIRQLLENEGKIKCFSLMKYNVLSLDDLRSDLQSPSQSVEYSDLSDCIPSPEEIMLPSNDEKNAIYFVAGYISRSVLNRTKCSSCRSILVSDLVSGEPNLETESCLVEQISRGGLFHPSEFCYDICILCWKLASYLFSNQSVHDRFLSGSNQKVVFIDLFQTFSINHVCPTDCENGHPFVRYITGSFFNCVYKNFVNESEIGHSGTCAKIAKLSSKKR